MCFVALNIADLAEHTIDAVPDRVALICVGAFASYLAQVTALGKLRARRANEIGRASCRERVSECV